MGDCTSVITAAVRVSTLVLPGFAKLPWTGTASAAALPWAIEIEGAGGLTVRCREALSVEDLIRLLQGSLC